MNEFIEKHPNLFTVLAILALPFTVVYSMILSIFDMLGGSF